MDKIIVTGGRQIYGNVQISGSKNVSLGILAASILNKEPVHLMNLCNVSDVTSMMNLLINLDSDIQFDGTRYYDNKTASNILIINNKNLKNYTIDYDFVSKMRASIFTLGPILSRFGYAKISLPGGCAIGVRPVNLYIEGLKAMGAEVDIHNGYVIANTNGKRLHGADITFSMISNGATQCIICAATLAEGETIIRNASCEPEVFFVAEFLNKCGAKISGHGTDTIKIQGVVELNEAFYTIPPDRIEAGTYAIISAVTDGDIVLNNCNYSVFNGCINEFVKIGIGVEKIDDSSVRCFRSRSKLQSCDIITAPYPGFPTDMQAQIMTALCLAEGESIVTENIFENRFMHVAELNRMGANITIEHNTAIVHGIDAFEGANVMATDLRASVSLIIAGLVENNKTTVNRIYHLDRGYDRIVSKLKNCNAEIERVRG